MKARLLILLALFLAHSPASAWWEYGHYTVARVAERTVKASTRAAVRRLISRSALLETPACAVRTLEDASYWPDCIKPLGDRFSYSFPWHYQNVDICKPFDPASACRDGNCVSAQIERNAKLLADKSLPARERLMALAFLTHFVGDLHMPLHAGDRGDRGDRGGNDFKASYGVIAGRANLHSIWDGWIAERAISTPPGDAAGILASLVVADRDAMRGGSVTDWSREAWEASRDFAYGSVMDDPCGPVPAARPVIDEPTTQRLIPIVRRQIARGGLRLARLLDEALG
ncbi:MAG: S1/P1 nuclease [Pseudomonadota bacterium]|nr:S1/P1 nuclease [Pseudomonadota bacterium]